MRLAIFGRIFATLLVASALASPFARAGNTDERIKDLECRLADMTPDQTTFLEIPPSYFAKPSPDGQWMGYISGGNHLIHLNDPGTIVDLPGNVDPVITPDGKFLITPSITDKNEFVGLGFFETSKLLKAARTGEAASAENVPAAFEDTDQGALIGVYQSIGIRPQSRNYRVAIDRWGELNYREYKPTTDALGESRLEAVGPVQPLCRGMKLATPMISKDGKYVGALSDGVTKIFRIEDDGTCTEALDLGMATGKVEFSHDGKRIAFHVNAFHPETSTWFSGVADAESKNIYVVDIEENAAGRLTATKWTPITNHYEPGSGSYYPAFLKDGSLVFMTARRDRSHRSLKTYSFQTTDPGRYASIPNFVGPCPPGDPFGKYLTLGKLWSSVCSKYDELPLVASAALLTLTSEPATCRQLVQAHWSEVKTNAEQELTVDDLLAACPQESPVKPIAKPVIRGTPVSLTRKAKQIFEGSCRDCHLPGSKNGHIDFENLTLGQVDEILLRIDSKSPLERMPYNSELDESEKVILRKELKERHDQLTR